MHQVTQRNMIDARKIPELRAIAYCLARHERSNCIDSRDDRSSCALRPPRSLTIRTRTDSNVQFTFTSRTPAELQPRPDGVNPPRDSGWDAQPCRPRGPDREQEAPFAPEPRCERAAIHAVMPRVVSTAPAPVSPTIQRAIERSLERPCEFHAALSQISIADLGSGPDRAACGAWPGKCRHLRHSDPGPQHHETMSDCTKHLQCNDRSACSGIPIPRL
jgi:hypothetical protein